MSLILSDFGKKLNLLCKEKFKEDYNYVCLTKNIYLFKYEKPINITPKPNKGLYFSKIIFEIDDNTNEEIAIPEWYKWIINEDYLVENYEKSDLLFAKLNLSQLRNLNEFMPINNPKLGFLDNYNWDDISNNCNGIIVNEYKNLWDIHQIVIWSSNAVIDYKYYTNEFKLIQN